ncbi:uncharacterized protein RJT21DRAFT_5405 [Scheffersomyces amazonensis]|uniref:uncharacterized protein n=1 Tax=Scheffersomyces amazonensis TaxID=1078765 RepID=UPI00315DB036
MTPSSSPGSKRHSIINVFPPSSSSDDTYQYEVSFSKATINWIKEFPSCSYICYDNITEPLVLYKMARIMLPDSEFINKDNDSVFFLEDPSASANDNDNDNDNSLSLQINLVPDHVNDDLIIKQLTIRQFGYLEQLINHHVQTCISYNASLQSLLPFPVDSLNWLKFGILKDHKELYRFCQMFLFIGLYTSKFSTFGPTYIEFLNQNDQFLLKSYLKVCQVNELKHQPIQEVGIYNEDDIYGDDYSDISDLSDMKQFNLTNRNEVSNGNQVYNSLQLQYNSTLMISKSQFDAIKWENALLEKLIYQMK